MKNFFIGLAAGLSLLAGSAYADVAQQVNADHSFARMATQAQRNSACFMQLTNLGDSASLVAAQSSAAGVVELHTHIHDNGVMRMRKIDKIDLPENQTVELKPGGLHIMLINLKRDLMVGDYVDLLLQFSDGSSKKIQVPVQSPGAK